ncbi:MAG: GNAT family N-acetyltransferase [Ardenticatenaceae bacterium]|nr:GNAT family N-acetyltransferase [Ardenticatenaceae bacterium]
MAYLLSPSQAKLLADTLPDLPQTVISISQLRRGLAQAYVVGDVMKWETAVIFDPGQPGEPTAFGHNAAQIADLMVGLPNWFCVNVLPEVAAELGSLLAAQMGCPVRYYGDIYHTLTTPAPHLPHSTVRRLTMVDLPLLQAAPASIRGHDPARMLAEMFAAGAVVNGRFDFAQRRRIVAIAQNYALSDRYGDIGVATLPDFRGQGLATAAAALVAQDVQANGRIPVWSCGEDNHASLRVAQKLGFVYDSRRTYIILQKEAGR